MFTNLILNFHDNIQNSWIKYCGIEPYQTHRFDVNKIAFDIKFEHHVSFVLNHQEIIEWSALQDSFERSYFMLNYVFQSRIIPGNVALFFICQLFEKYWKEESILEFKEIIQEMNLLFI